jgi:phosphatidylserine synthase
LITNVMNNPIVYFIVPIIFSLLMLSSLRMFSLKGMEKPFIKNRYQIILFASFIALLLIDNKLAIPLTVIMFIFLSILQSSRRKL